MGSRTIDHRVHVSAETDVVWERVVSPLGFNDEMRPWITMSMPRRARGLTVANVPLGVPLGRAWLRLFGVVPFDYDVLVIVELEPGRRFLERSTMFSAALGARRTVTPTMDGTEIHDRVTFEPRLLLRPMS